MRGFNNRDRFLWWATAVLLLAAIMRLVLLHDIPPGLAQDEVRNADIVYFIRQGVHALFFATGYGHEPLYHYFTVPFQALLGDNMLSIRLPSVFLGMLLVAGTLRWVKRDFGVVTAVLAGFSLAVGWQAVIFSRIGIRPIMQPLFLVGAIWFWQKRPVLAGLFLGLTIYTYTGARVVFAIPILFALVQAALWWHERKDAQSGTLRSRVQPILLILAITALIYLPLHLTLQADPSLQARVEQLQGPVTALMAGDIQPVWEMTVATLGVFSVAGPPRWTYTIQGLPLFNGVTAVFFYAGVLISLWRIRQPRYALVLIWLVVGIAPSALTTHAPSIIRMIGAVPVIYLLPAIAVAAGLQRLAQTRWQRPAYLLLLMPYLLFLTAHTITNGFILWPAAEITRDKYQAALLDMGRYWDAHEANGMVVVQNFFMPIEIDTMRRNMGYDVGARWVQSSPEIAGALVRPDGESAQLFVPEYAAPYPELMQAAGVLERPLYRSEKRPSFAVYTFQQPLNISHPLDPVLFDEKISLIGYEMGEAANNQIQLFTYWQVEAPLPADLAAFVHFLDADGNLISQHDGLDVAPSTLSANDLIIQRHVIPFASSLPDGYSLQVGLYTRSNNNRLTHPGLLSDRFILVEMP
jgi:4-amino-4-deoxy-L-arabinose transferase-like glycosyltransferase